MSSKKAFRFLSWASTLLYICIVGLFIWNVLNFSNAYKSKEMTYLSNIENQIAHILNTTSDEELIQKQMTTLREEFPLEAILEKGPKIVYNSVPYLISQNMIGALNQDALLIEAQGSFADYDIWYAIYHMPNELFLIPFLRTQAIILGCALLLLSLVVTLTRRGFKIPLIQLKDSIAKIKNYDFHDIQGGSDDLNTEMRAFSSDLENKIYAVERIHTDLETALQIERERLSNTITVSRSFIHDLKSPIHQVLMENQFYLSQLKEPSAETEELAQITIEKTEQTILSINEILRMMQHDNYANGSSVESFDIISNFYDAIRQFSTSFKINHFRTSLELDESILVVMNKAAYQLLVHNLLSNMTQYAKHGSILEIQIYQEDTSVKLSFSNISTLENIANMKKSEGIFNTITQDLNKNTYSSGNGLFLIKDLATILNGHYHLETHEDQITIEIQLPLGSEDHETTS